jgi:CHAT domain-containing protein
VATGNIETVAEQGTAGNINVTAQADIQTGNLTSSGGDGSLQGFANSGSIQVSSEQSSVTTGNVTSQAVSGETGTLTIVASEAINTGNLTSNAANNSGNITLISQESTIFTGNIASIVQQGTVGNINVWALNNIQTGHIISLAGEGIIGWLNNSDDIQLLSSQGSVTTGNITSQALSGDAGDINILAEDDVNTGNLTSIGVNDSGDIALTSIEGSVLTGDIATIAEQGTTGNINVDAQVDINTGTITSDGGEASGNIALSAEGTINTGQISTDNGIITINGEVINPLVENLEENLPEEVTNSSGEGASNSSENSSLLESSILSVEDAAQINQATASPESEMSLSENPLLNSQTNQQILSSLNAFNQTPLSLNTSEAVTQIEQQRSAEFAEHFGDNLEHQFMTLTSVRNALGNIARQTGNQSAIVYMAALPDGLEIIVISAEGQPIRATVASASREELFQVITDYRAELTTPTRRASKSYLKLAQQLYDWLIAPIEAELEAQGIDTLLFSMDAGLRGLPIAALHDGQQFLVEKYSLSLIPSVSLMDTRYQSLRGTQVLAMGASTFPSMQPLPAVPLELSLITQQLWQGDMFLNEEFTRQNLREQRDRYPYPIVHLATHAEFQFEESEPPFIHLWDNDKLRLEEMRSFRWNNPPVELLVLSACRTAVGDRRAELGFAGLAVSAGVKSALASLWYVSDDGTLSFMAQFYNALEAAPLKAEAVRQAQIALIRGGAIVGVNPLRGEKSAQEISLPPELMNLEEMNFSHPYYWSGFTLIGSPW